MAAPTTVPKNAGGTLILGASSQTPPDYGGTILGNTRRLEFVSRKVYFPIRAAEYGGAEVDGVFKYFEAILRFTIASWDQAAVATYFAGVGVGTKGPTVPLTESALTTGSLMSDLSVSLTHVARHSGAASEDPSLRVFAAYPNDELSRIVLRDSEPSEFEAAFNCVLSSSLEVARIAALADL